MRRLSERSELSRSWMGGAAARPLEVKHLKDAVLVRSKHAWVLMVYGCAAAPPIPTFPHKGGRGSFFCLVRHCPLRRVPDPAQGGLVLLFVEMAHQPGAAGD